MIKYVSAIFLLIIIIISEISLAELEHVKFAQVLRNTANKSFSIVRDELNTTQLRVLVAITIKDNAYSLPTFLASLESLKCPNANKKCHLWIIFDNCTDRSYDIFTYWLASTRTLFDTIIMLDTKNDLKTKEKHAELDEWYFSSNLKMRALKFALDREFSHVFFLNADTILTNLNTIEILLKKKKTIVAPLLNSVESMHSTYWLRQNYNDSNEPDLFYAIYTRKQVGCFKVNGVQESFLLDLSSQNLDKLFTQNGLIQNLNADVELSLRAQHARILQYVCNRDQFGYVPDRENEPDEDFILMRMQHLLNGPNKTYNAPLGVTQHLDKVKKRKTKLGFDHIYVVNLERRADRRERIESALDDLNLSFQMTKAVDSKILNEEYLNKLGIQVIPDYVDSYHDRSINYGEIACFLSHYNIWKDMIEKGYERVIVLEDDAKFVAKFKSVLSHIMNEVNEKKIDWDLVYLGRKIMPQYAHLEKWNYDVSFKYGHGLRHIEFTHWTVAYALSRQGALKLVDSEPLKKILPIDEYLPLMYGKQPNEYWASFFPEKNLIAYAIQPAIVTPTHYFGEPNYVSDTEHTPILDKSKFEIKLDEPKFRQNSHIEL